MNKSRWDRLQPPRDPTDGLSGCRKWMDGSKWKTFCQLTSKDATDLFYHEHDCDTFLNYRSTKKGIKGEENFGNWAE